MLNLPMTKASLGLWMNFYLSAISEVMFYVCHIVKMFKTLLVQHYSYFCLELYNILNVYIASVCVLFIKFQQKRHIFNHYCLGLMSHV